MAAPVVRGNSVEVRIRDNDLQQGLTKLRELSQPLGGLLSATGQRSLDIVSVGGGLVRLTPTEPAIVERIRQAVEQSIGIVEKRVDELGTVEPVIQRQGVDRILVQVPGLQDPQRLKELIGRTAKLDFRMVDQTHDRRAGAADAAAAGVRSPLRHRRRTASALSDREARASCRAAISIDAQPGFDQRTSEPIVSSASTPRARASSRRPPRRTSDACSRSCSTTK